MASDTSLRDVRDEFLWMLIRRARRYPTMPEGRLIRHVEADFSRKWPNIRIERRDG